MESMLKESIPPRMNDAEYENLVLRAFLEFIGKQIEEHPELTVEADEAQLQRIAELVKETDYKEKRNED